jgi:hypothetical protein
MYAEQKMASGSVGAAQLAQEPGTRQAEVPHQMDMLQRNVKGVAEIIAQLEQRLCSVVRPEAPINTQDKALRGAPATDLGARMQDFNDQLVALRVRAESLVARLEV